MSSKLPKPSGLKPPQIRATKPLGTISENVINRNIAPQTEQKIKAHEAPPPSTSSMLCSRLKRRSKSVTDLRSIADRPLNLKPFKLPLKTTLFESKQTKVLTNKVPSKHTAVKPNGVSGTKRPLASKNDEGVSKPKVSKKIPDWDYKSRFNQLNERYQHAQECIKDMKVKVTRKYEQIFEYCIRKSKYNY